jgi:hypothetical protein
MRLYAPMVLVFGLFGSPLAHGGEPPEPAQEADGAEVRESEPPKNVFGVRAVYALQFLEPRESAVLGEVPPESDHLGGILLTYERKLVAERLALQVVTPFLIGQGRFDSPVELALKLTHRWDRFEPFVAGGLAATFRVFGGRRQDIEGTSNAASVGFLGAAGAVLWFREQTGVEVALDYASIVAGPVVESEATASAGLAFAF